MGFNIITNSAWFNFRCLPVRIMTNTYFYQMQPFLKIMQVSFAREFKCIEKLIFFATTWTQ